MRRYKRGEIAVYDQKYNTLLTTSPVINAARRQSKLNLALNLSYEQGIRSELIEIEGNQKGEVYYPDRQLYGRARIPVLEEKLREINAAFVHHKQKALEAGYNENQIAWPKQLQQEKYEMEAALDIKKLEAQRLRKMIEPYEKDREEKAKREVLQYGLGHSSKGEPVKIIDGQNVNKVNGVLCIRDENSPYDYMSLADYRVMSRKWRKEQGGKYRGGKVPASALPDWPAGVNNHKKDK